MPPGTLSWHPTLVSSTGKTHEQIPLPRAENATTLMDAAGYKRSRARARRARRQARAASRPGAPPAPARPRLCRSWGRLGPPRPRAVAGTPRSAGTAAAAAEPASTYLRSVCHGDASGAAGDLERLPVRAARGSASAAAPRDHPARHRLRPDLLADRPQHGPAPGASQAGAPRQRLPPGRLRRRPRRQARPPRRPRSAAAAPQTGSCIRSPVWQAAAPPGPRPRRRPRPPRRSGPAGVALARARGCLARRRRAHRRATPYGIRLAGRRWRRPARCGRARAQARALGAQPALRVTPLGAVSALAALQPRARRVGRPPGACRARCWGGVSGRRARSAPVTTLGPRADARTVRLAQSSEAQTGWAKARRSEDAHPACRRGRPAARPAGC